jgi:AP-2 complex subunit alpha
MGDDDALLEVVCEEMPPFPERESALLNRLHKKGDAAHDKRTWVIGGKGENKEREAARFKSFKDGAGSTPAPATSVAHQAVEQAPFEAEATTEPAGTYDMMGADPSGATDDVMSSLAGLDLGGPQAVQEMPLMAAVVDPQRNGTAESMDMLTEHPGTSSHTSTSVALAQMALTRGPDVEKVSSIRIAT